MLTDEKNGNEWEERKEKRDVSYEKYKKAHHHKKKILQSHRALQQWVHSSTTDVLTFWWHFAFVDD